MDERGSDDNQTRREEEFQSVKRSRGCPEFRTQYMWSSMPRDSGMLLTYELISSLPKLSRKYTIVCQVVQEEYWSMSFRLSNQKIKSVRYPIPKAFLKHPIYTFPKSSWPELEMSWIKALAYLWFPTFLKDSARPSGILTGLNCIWGRKSHLEHYP